MWEQRYNFLKPQRSCTNIRYYSNDELKTILNIALLNKYGFKISHIDRMQPDEICEKILALRDVEAIQERIINDLVVRTEEREVLWKNLRERSNNSPLYKTGEPDEVSITPEILNLILGLNNMIPDHDLEDY